MRRLLAVFVALIVLLALYVGSAVYSVSRLADAARAGDGAAVIARTNLRDLSQSLSDQLLKAYIERIGAARKVSAVEKMVVNTYGASIADAMIAKLLTAGSLTEMLKSGKFYGADQVPAFEGLPALGQVDANDFAGLLGRMGFIQPVLLSFRVSPTTDRNTYAAVLIHFEGTGWKLSGIELPPAIVRQLAANLPER
jgi:hypothetical protein